MRIGIAGRKRETIQPSQRTRRRRKRRREERRERARPRRERRREETVDRRVRRQPRRKRTRKWRGRKRAKPLLRRPTEGCRQTRRCSRRCLCPGTRRSCERRLRAGPGSAWLEMKKLLVQKVCSFCVIFNSHWSESESLDFPNKNLYCSMWLCFTFTWAKHVTLTHNPLANLFKSRLLDKTASTHNSLPFSIFYLLSF